MQMNNVLVMYFIIEIIWLFNCNWNVCKTSVLCTKLLACIICIINGFFFYYISHFLHLIYFGKSVGYYNYVGTCQARIHTFFKGEKGGQTRASHMKMGFQPYVRLQKHRVYVICACMTHISRSYCWLIQTLVDSEYEKYVRATIQAECMHNQSSSYM